MNKIFVALLANFSSPHVNSRGGQDQDQHAWGCAHFTMHLAQKRGFLKEEGFEAEIITISGPVANVALSNGDIDYFSGFGSALRSILQGLPLRIVACYRPTPHFMLQSRPEFKSVKDLKGKTIGITTFGSGTELVGRMMVKHFGLDPDKDVKWVRRWFGRRPLHQNAAGFARCHRSHCSRTITLAGRWASLSLSDRKTSLPIPSAA